MVVYLFTSGKPVLPREVARVFSSISEGVGQIGLVSPDAVVIDLHGMDPGCLREVRRAFDEPIVVVAEGADAAQAIRTGANDWADSYVAAVERAENALCRHQARQAGQALGRKVNTLLAMAGC